jgi:hypothetical protein
MQARAECAWQAPAEAQALGDHLFWVAVSACVAEEALAPPHLVEL